MTKSFGTFGVVLLSACAAAAQDVPQMEAFLGYTLVRFGSSANEPAFTSNGGSGQFAYNFNKWFGGVADLRAVHNSHIYDSHVDNTATNFLFGPRVSFRYPRMRPYFQVLVGGVYYAAGYGIEGSLPSPLPQYRGFSGESVIIRITRSQTAFAMTAGGGLDIQINKYLSFRPIGLDFFLTRLVNLRTLEDNSQQNFRYTTGSTSLLAGQGKGDAMCAEPCDIHIPLCGIIAKRGRRCNVPGCNRRNGGIYEWASLASGD